VRFVFAIFFEVRRDFNFRIRRALPRAHPIAGDLYYDPETFDLVSFADSTSQAEVLRVLRGREPMTLREIGGHLICERGSPSRLVTRRPHRYSRARAEHRFGNLDRRFGRRACACPSKRGKRALTRAVLGSRLRSGVGSRAFGGGWYDVLMGPTLHRFSTSDYEEMAEQGLLPEKGLELLDGLVVTMSPKGDRHRHAVRQLAKQLFAQERDRYETDSESLSLRIGATDEPDPDITLSWPRADGKRPIPADVFLIVEVSESSLHADLVAKRDLYARAGVPEYWVVNLIDDRIETFRVLRDDAYQEHAFVTAGELSPVAMSDVRIDVAAIIKRFRNE